MKKYMVICLAGLILALGLLMVLNMRQAKSYGSVIVLNGPSAAGKSSIQKSFQDAMLPSLWIKLGVDNLFDKPMPDIDATNFAYWQKENRVRWVTTTQDREQNPIITLFAGPEGERVAYGMNSAIAAYAKAGCNVIVDYIAYKKEWIDDLHQKLSGINTCWVKVNIPLDVLEKRELGRGTSPKGHARSHYGTVHWDVQYDLEVDSGTDSAVVIAQQIKKFLKL